MDAVGMKAEIKRDLYIKQVVTQALYTKIKETATYEPGSECHSISVTFFNRSRDVHLDFSTLFGQSSFTNPKRQC